MPEPSRRSCPDGLSAGLSSNTFLRLPMLAEIGSLGFCMKPPTESGWCNYQRLPKRAERPLRQVRYWICIFADLSGSLTRFGNVTGHQADDGSKDLGRFEGLLDQNASGTPSVCQDLALSPVI